MPGNTIGHSFRLTTFGESHGSAIGGVIDGCPAGVDIDVSAIQELLDKRRPGQSRHTTQRNERDTIQILSGIFEGTTTGAPIGLLIHNTDQKSKDYADIANVFRPGHADYTYHHKYGIRDYRGGGRSSARETAIRVAAGAFAMQVLAQEDIQIHACVEQIGNIKSHLAVDEIHWQQVATNPLYFADPQHTTQLTQYIHLLRSQGDSIGAQLLLVVCNVPIGLGEPIFDRLEADLAKAMLSINASKAVAFGDGFSVVHQRGSEHRDLLSLQGFTSNHAGGVLGGISTGQDIIARIAFKPTSSITTPGETINTNNEPVFVRTKGRHDPCVGIRAVPIVQAMAALVLVDHWLRNRLAKK